MFYGAAHADNYITQNIVGGCDTTDLLTVNNKTQLKPIFEPIEYTCNAGTFLPANSTQCAPCPSGFTCSGGTFAFNESKAGGISAPANITQSTQKVCSTNVLMTTQNNKTRLKPIFEPIEYTCNAGTFLPANSTQCAPCPSGFTCSGGTFIFNESKAEGITAPTSITQSAAKICSTNVLTTTPNNKTQLKPIFEPKVVTVNWDDGQGGTSVQTTCNYDGLINLPPTPTRPGYEFSGWKLQVNE